MAQITQTNRLLSLHTPLGENTLILTELTGTERLSTPFELQLTALSQQKSLDTNRLLGQPVTITLNYRQQTPRYFHGITKQIKQGNQDDAGYQTYQLTIVPWLWFLCLSRNCRVFQNQSVVDIFKTICREHGFNDFNLSSLTKRYPPLNYCVQYNESALQFISRLFEQAGIYYYFNFKKDCHTLVLIDNSQKLPKDKLNITYSNNAHNSQHLHQWKSEQCFSSHTYSSNDYNFKTPKLNLYTQIKGTKPSPKIMGAIQLEQFTYPGQFSSKMQGDQINKSALQAANWQTHCVYANGNYTHFYAGLNFKLTAHQDQTALGRYYIQSVSHQAHDFTHLNHLPEHQQCPQLYQNTLCCISEQYPYAPPLSTKKPIIDGSQTATVVGPKGKAIYTDKYGRIKIQFHWDRLGKFDEHSSCWVRTLQAFAHHNWGSQFIPRLGQQVIVQFIDGDPDKPVVIGSAHTGTQQQPFPLPQQQTQSGIKTRSLGSENPNHCNILRFDDKPNHEQLYLQAQKDLTIEALNDYCELTGQGKTTVIDQQQLIKALNGNATISANKITLQVGASSLIINDSGITLKSPTVKLLAKGAGAKKPAARVGDQHSCPKLTAVTPHCGGPILKGSPNVLINKQQAARQGDSAHCLTATDQIKQGTNNITINGKPAAKLNDKMKHGGIISSGSPNVIIGERETSCDAQGTGNGAVGTP